MAASPQSAITLVQKKGALVPQKSERKSTLEMNGYTLGKTLGEGAYAKVKLATSKKHNRNVAIKIINKRRATKEYLAKFLPREIQVLTRLKHPYLTKFYEVLETQSKVYLVMEYVEQGDLLEFLNKNDTPHEEVIRALFQQLVLAVDYCHKEKVVHRDIKCENILLDAKKRLKLTDFGFATNTYKHKPLETFCGSFAYACPQILRGDNYDGMAADVWSVGVVLYALCCSRLPYGEDELKLFVKNAPQKKLMFTKNVGKECRALIRSMLDPDEKTRITCSEILENEWCKIDIANVLCEMSRPSLVPEECAPTQRRVTIHEGNEERQNSSGSTQQEDRRMSFQDEVTMIANDLASKSRMKQYHHDATYKEPAPSQRRRSSLVSDVVRAEKSAVNQRRRQSIIDRKQSLVSDVTITSPQQAAINTRKMSYTPVHQVLSSKPAGSETGEFNEEEILYKSKKRIEDELCGLKHTTAGVAARLAAEETYNEHHRKKEIAIQESIRKVSASKSKEGRLGKFMRKCAKIMQS